MRRMRAVVVTRPGGPEVLEMVERPRPVPAEEGIVVRVHAAALNRADILQRRGRYPAPPGWPADIPGLEYAGEVEAVGARVSRWRGGHRVMGRVGGGACAVCDGLGEVHAAALNRADPLPRRGRYPAPPGWPADIPGLEYAGEVEAVGARVSRWRAGDRVMGLVGGGAYAECVAVHQDEALAIPPSLS